MEASERRLTRPAGLSLTEPPAPPAKVADAAVSSAAPAAQARDRPDSAAALREEPASIPAARARPAEEAQLFRSLEERLTQLPASAASVADISPAAPISTLQLVLIALAAICLLASAVLSVAAARRRRTQIQIVDLGAKAPLRMPVAASNVTAPRHSPVEDDAEVDEERLRQFTRAWKEAPSMWRREPARDLIAGAHRFADNDMSHAGV